VYTAPSESAALDAFAELSALNAFEITFGGRCPPHGSNTPIRSSYTVNLTDPTGRVPNLIECWDIPRRAGGSIE
jgi:hypothetical protein